MPTPSLDELKQKAKALEREFFHAMDLENTPMSFMSDVDDDRPMAEDVAEPAGQRLDQFLLNNPRLGTDPEWASMYDGAVRRAAVEAEVEKRRAEILAEADNAKPITPVERPAVSQRTTPAMRALHIPADLEMPVTVFKIEDRFDIRELLRTDIGQTSNDRDAAIYFDEHGQDNGAALNDRATDYVLNHSATAKQARKNGVEPAYAVHGDVIMVGENRSGELTTTPGRIEREFGTFKHQAVDADELRDRLAQQRGHHH